MQQEINLEFAYSDVRVKAMKHSILGQPLIRELVDVKSVDEVIAILQNSAYKQPLIDASTRFSGVELLQKALNAELGDSLGRLLRAVPRRFKPILRAILQVHDIENIKILFAKKHFGQDISVFDFITLGKQDADFLLELSRKGSLDDVVAALQSKEYYRVLLPAFQEFKKSSSLTVIFDSLDRFYFNNLMSKITRETSGFKKLVASKIELQDMLIALRLKERGCEKDAKKYLINPSHSVANSILNSRDLREAMDYAKRKFAIKKELSTSSQLEVELEKIFIQKALKMLRTTVLNFGTILGFYYLKCEEIAMLRKIALSKQYGLSEQMRGEIFSVSD